MSDQPDENVVNLTIVGQAIAEADPAPPVPASSGVPTHHDDGPGHADDGNGGGGASTDVGLPDWFPVIPLGKDGLMFWFLDADRQLVPVKAEKFSRLTIMSLFGSRYYLLEEHFPQWKGKGDDAFVDGFRAEKVQAMLMPATARMGIWNPLDKVRGPGAWAADDGRLILHCGDVVLFGTRSKAPGMIGREVYPGSEPLPKPAVGKQCAGDEGPAMWLLKLLNSWNWARGEVDAMLLLGWIGAARIGGALKWRPLTWITGGRGTGKSTLHDEVIKPIFDRGLVSVSDATGAGIWQKIGYSTLPVALDELEAESDNRKAAAIIKLARQASSGGVVLRGSQDHTSQEFMARSCFMFSSILIPPLEVQDMSRMAILSLNSLPKGASLSIDPGKMKATGQAITRRLMDGWDRLQAVLPLYRSNLMAVGHDNRGADQFGTLLAVADVMLFDETNEKYVKNWCSQLDATAMNEFADQISDEIALIEFLTTISADIHRSGFQKTYREWIEKAAGPEGEIDQQEAQDVLSRIGLRVVAYEKDGVKDDYLAVANSHAGLFRLLENTKWQKGGHAQSLRRIDGHIRPGQPLYLGPGAGNKRCTLVPLHLILPKQVRAKEPPPIDTDFIPERDDPFHTGGD